MAAPHTYIIVHHTGGTASDPRADTSHHTFEIVDNFHRDKWQFRSSLGHYTGYHYFINKQGILTQGRADTDLGAHTIGYNNQIGICLAGNFDLSYPTEAQAQTLATLLAAKVEEYGIPKEHIVPHRMFAQKTCYGTNLSNEWAQDLLRNQIIKPPTQDMLVYKHVHSPKLYIAVGTVLIPIDTSFNAYARDLGHATIIELSEKQFSKFDIASSIHITETP